MKAMSTGMLSRSNQASSGIAPSNNARPMSVVTWIGRRRSRSASTPATRPNTRYGSHRAELTRPTSVADPSSVTTTRTCRASVVTDVPNSETVNAPPPNQRLQRVAGQRLEVLVGSLGVSGDVHGGYCLARIGGPAVRSRTD